MAKARIDTSDLDEISAAFDEEEASRGNFVRTFYMPKGSEKRIVFLSEKPQTFGKGGARVAKVHYLRLQGRNKPYTKAVTSPVTLDTEANDPLIDAGSTPKNTMFFTIVVITKWTDGQDKVHAWEKMPLQIKGESGAILLKNISNLRKRGDNLKGAVFSVSRGKNKMSPNTGNVFTYEKNFSDKFILAKMKEHDPNATLDEIDIEALFAPPKERELMTLAKQAFGKVAVRERDEDDEDEDEDDEDERPRNKKKSRRIEAEADDEDEDDVEEENPFDDEE